ncbi:hypothetical protein [Rufibacter latericius]|uniref:Glycerophosphoryl diester phosphodiesterase membrane domain-containing protein n=1 Tax=Rufibacter latericius TaxID=2487040 RepID=A0A3M9MTG6_9BACT|nr:hypothetical protein [Rufibacter latericius]RNI28816.1 hypothetical protein EFB08_09320 [Rufibacter latericius]
MKDPLIEFRLERDARQKMNATLGFLRQNFKPLFRCVVMYVVPFALLAGIFSGIYQNSLLKELSGAVQYGGSMGAYSFAQNVKSLHYWVSLFFSLVSFVLLGLTIYSYMQQYRQNDGRVEQAEVWESIKRNFISVLYSGVGVVLMVGLATLLLVLPGIYVAVAMCLFVMVMLEEEVGFLDAVERCFFLIKGHWWSSFGFLLLALLIQGIIGFVASVPSMTIYVLRILKLPGTESDMLLIAATSFSTFIGLLLYAFSITAIGFLYFDLVEKKEGVGLLEQVNQIGAQPKTLVEIDAF